MMAFCEILLSLKNLSISNLYINFPLRTICYSIKNHNLLGKKPKSFFNYSGKLIKVNHYKT